MSGLIIQANLHHSKFATDCLVHDMMLAKCQVVALIQEPYLGGRNYPVGIPKLFGCYYQGEGGRGRSIILTKGCNHRNNKKERRFITNAVQRLFLFSEKSIHIMQKNLLLAQAKNQKV